MKKRYHNKTMYRITAMPLLLFCIFVSAARIFAQEKSCTDRDLLLAPEQKKVEILNCLSENTRNSDPKKAMNYAEKALNLSKKLNDKIGEANSLSNIGVCYYYTGNPNLSQQNHLSALQIFTELSDMQGMSNCYNNLAILFQEKGGI